MLSPTTKAAHPQPRDTKESEMDPVTPILDSCMTFCKGNLEWQHSTLKRLLCTFFQEKENFRKGSIFCGIYPRHWRKKSEWGYNVRLTGLAVFLSVWHLEFRCLSAKLFSSLWVHLTCTSPVSRSPHTFSPIHSKTGKKGLSRIFDSLKTVTFEACSRNAHFLVRHVFGWAQKIEIFWLRLEKGKAFAGALCCPNVLPWQGLFSKVGFDVLPASLPSEWFYLRWLTNVLLACLWERGVPPVKCLWIIYPQSVILIDDNGAKSDHLNQ